MTGTVTGTDFNEEVRIALQSLVILVQKVPESVMDIFLEGIVTCRDVTNRAGRNTVSCRCLI
jgi:hypothetical protein